MQEYVCLLTQIHKHLYSQVHKAVHGEEVTVPERLVEPGNYIYIHMFKRKNFNVPWREGQFKVVLATPTAVKLEGRDHWYHLNHCSHGAGKGRLLHPAEGG